MLAFAQCETSKQATNQPTSDDSGANKNSEKKELNRAFENDFAANGTVLSACGSVCFFQSAAAVQRHRVGARAVFD